MENQPSSTSVGGGSVTETFKPQQPKVDENKYQAVVPIWQGNVKSDQRIIPAKTDDKTVIGSSPVYSPDEVSLDVVSDFTVASRKLLGHRATPEIEIAYLYNISDEPSQNDAATLEFLRKHNYDHHQAMRALIFPMSCGKEWALVQYLITLSERTATNAIYNEFRELVLRKNGHQLLGSYNSLDDENLLKVDEHVFDSDTDNNDEVGGISHIKASNISPLLIDENSDSMQSNPSTGNHIGDHPLPATSSALRSSQRGAHNEKTEAKKQWLAILESAQSLQVSQRRSTQRIDVKIVEKLLEDSIAINMNFPTVFSSNNEDYNNIDKLRMLLGDIVKKTITTRAWIAEIRDFVALKVVNAIIHDTKPPKVIGRRDELEQLLSRAQQLDYAAQDEEEYLKSSLSLMKSNIAQMKTILTRFSNRSNFSPLLTCDLSAFHFENYIRKLHCDDHYENGFKDNHYLQNLSHSGNYLNSSRLVHYYMGFNRAYTPLVLEKLLCEAFAINPLKALAFEESAALLLPFEQYSFQINSGRVASTATMSLDSAFIEEMLHLTETTQNSVTLQELEDLLTSFHRGVIFRVSEVYYLQVITQVAKTINSKVEEIVKRCNAILRAKKERSENDTKLLLNFQYVAALLRALQNFPIILPRTKELLLHMKRVVAWRANVQALVENNAAQTMSKTSKRRTGSNATNKAVSMNRVDALLTEHFRLPFHFEEELVILKEKKEQSKQWLDKLKKTFTFANAFQKQQRYAALRHGTDATTGNIVSATTTSSSASCAASKMTLSDIKMMVSEGEMLYDLENNAGASGSGDTAGASSLSRSVLRDIDRANALIENASDWIGKVRGFLLAQFANLDSHWNVAAIGNDEERLHSLLLPRASEDRVVTETDSTESEVSSAEETLVTQRQEVMLMLNSLIEEADALPIIIEESELLKCQYSALDWAMKARVTLKNCALYYQNCIKAHGNSNSVGFVRPRYNELLAMKTEINKIKDKFDRCNPHAADGDEKAEERDSELMAVDSESAESAEVRSEESQLMRGWIALPEEKYCSFLVDRADNLLARIKKAMQGKEIRKGVTLYTLKELLLDALKIPVNLDYELRAVKYAFNQALQWIISHSSILSSLQLFHAEDQQLIQEVAQISNEHNNAVIGSYFEVTSNGAQTNSGNDHVEGHENNKEDAERVAVDGSATTSTEIGTQEVDDDLLSLEELQRSANNLNVNFHSLSLLKSRWLEIELWQQQVQSLMHRFSAFLKALQSDSSALQSAGEGDEQRHQRAYKSIISSIVHELQVKSLTGLINTIHNTHHLGSSNINNQSVATNEGKGSSSAGNKKRKASTAVENDLEGEAPGTEELISPSVSSGRMSIAEIDQLLERGKQLGLQEHDDKSALKHLQQLKKALELWDKLTQNYLVSAADSNCGQFPELFVFTRLLLSNTKSLDVLKNEWLSADKLAYLEYVFTFARNVAQEVFDSHAIYAALETVLESPAQSAVYAKFIRPLSAELKAPRVKLQLIEKQLREYKLVIDKILDRSQLIDHSLECADECIMYRELFTLLLAVVEILLTTCDDSATVTTTAVRRWADVDIQELKFLFCSLKSLLKLLINDSETDSKSSIFKLPQKQIHSEHSESNALAETQEVSAEMTVENMEVDNSASLNAVSRKRKSSELHSVVEEQSAGDHAGNLHAKASTRGSAGIRKRKKDDDFTDTINFNLLNSKQGAAMKPPTTAVDGSEETPSSNSRAGKKSATVSTVGGSKLVSSAWWSNISKLCAEDNALDSAKVEELVARYSLSTSVWQALAGDRPRLRIVSHVFESAVFFRDLLQVFISRVDEASAWKEALKQKLALMTAGNNKSSSSHTSAQLSPEDNSVGAVPDTSSDSDPSRLREFLQLAVTRGIECEARSELQEKIQFSEEWIAKVNKIFSAEASASIYPTLEQLKDLVKSADAVIFAHNDELAKLKQELKKAKQWRQSFDELLPLVNGSSSSSSSSSSAAGGGLNEKVAALRRAAEELKVNFNDCLELLSVNNKLYCLCRQGNFGEMIGCDSCEEWFHLGCVNLTPAQAQKCEHYCCILCSLKNSFIKSAHRAFEVVHRWLTSEDLNGVRENQIQKLKKKLNRESMEYDNMRLLYQQHHQLMASMSNNAAHNASTTASSLSSESVAATSSNSAAVPGNAIGTANKSAEPLSAKSNPLPQLMKDLEQQRASIQQLDAELQELNKKYSFERQKKSQIVKFMQAIFSILRPMSALDDLQLFARVSPWEPLRKLALLSENKGISDFGGKMRHLSYHLSLLLPEAVQELTTQFAEILVVEDVKLIVDVFKWMSWCCFTLQLLRYPAPSVLLRQAIASVEKCSVADEKITKQLTQILNKSNQWKSKVRKLCAANKKIDEQKITALEIEGNNISITSRLKTMLKNARANAGSASNALTSSAENAESAGQVAISSKGRRHSNKFAKDKEMFSSSLNLSASGNSSTSVGKYLLAPEDCYDSSDEESQIASSNPQNVGKNFITRYSYPVDIELALGAAPQLPWPVPWPAPK